MRRCEAHEGEEVIGVRIGILVFVIAVGITGGASSGAAASREPAQRPHTRVATSPQSCPYAQLGVVFYRDRYVHHQLQRGASVQSWRKPRNCADARYLANVWAKRSYVARVKTKRYQAARTLRDFVVRDGNRAWRKAVKEAQKPYPGTEAWLLSCSDSEGGWGRWVPNNEGSGVGGWMQMYPSTWSTMFYGWYGNEGALSYLKRKGYIVPRSAHSWYSPLGQALASAHGKLNGRGGEWHGAGC